MITIKEKLLASFKKANKQARERIAVNNGFKNGVAYVKYLTTPSVAKTKTGATKAPKPLIKPIEKKNNKK